MSTEMVSVIVPTYSRSDRIQYAIESVLKQSYKNIELVVVDDNGLGTEEQIKTNAVISKLNDSRIVYYPHETNKGGCAARNTGIKNSHGEYVAFLDDDDIWSDKFIKSNLSLFKNVNVGAVYCDFWSYDGVYSKKLKNRSVYSGNVHDRILSGWCPASTSLFVVKKESIVKAGLFDESLPSFQDYDMWLRLSEVCDFAYNDSILVVKYEGFGEQTSRNPKRRVAGYTRICEKYEQSLPDAQRELFKGFIKKYKSDTLFRCVVYKKSNKQPYKSELKEYLSLNRGIKKRLHIFMKLHLDEKTYSKISRIMSAFLFKNDLRFFKGLVEV